METEGTPAVLSNLAVPPGELLQEELDAIGMTQQELARRTGRPAQAINEIIHGRKRITHDTALELEKVLGIPAYLWVRLEADYELTAARLRDQEALREQEEWLKEFPVREMERRRWMQPCKKRTDKVRELLKFLGVASFSAWQRRGLWCRITPGAKVSEGALAVWLRKGELDGRETQTAPYDEARFRQALEKARELITQPPGVFVPHLKRLCAAAGVALVFTQELPRSGASGSARWLTRETALIQLSLRYKTNDHLWFSFFHEAAHVLRRQVQRSYIDGVEEEGSAEEDANQFARDLLIPPEAWGTFSRAGDFSRAGVERFAADVGIAAGIVVGRLQHEGLLPYHVLNDLKVKLEWSEE